MTVKTFYGAKFPNIESSDLAAGKLIVLEGADGSGRSTQIGLLRDWLEQKGYATVEVGLKRSDWIGRELEKAKLGNILNPLTLSLFYATDFMDQFETKILPALQAGFIVLADRYIYSLIARAIARGIDADWVKQVYQMTLVPDAVFYLQISPKTLAIRNFRTHKTLDYWESGMDIERSGDMYHSFIKYQTSLQEIFEKLQGDYTFDILDGNRTPDLVARELRGKIESLLFS
jgi:dTMP kinase